MSVKTIIGILTVIGAAAAGAIESGLIPPDTTLYLIVAVLATVGGAKVALKKRQHEPSPHRSSGITTKPPELK